MRAFPARSPDSHAHLEPSTAAELHAAHDAHARNSSANKLSRSAAPACPGSGKSESRGTRCMAGDRIITAAMAFPVQTVTFDLINYAGLDFVIPDNPSGADIVALAIFLPTGVSADYAILRTHLDSQVWDVIAGATAGFVTGTIDNGATPPIPTGNAGRVDAGGAFAVNFGASPQNVRIQAMLGRRMGGAQGTR